MRASLSSVCSSLSRSASHGCQGFAAYASDGWRISVRIMACFGHLASLGRDPRTWGEAFGEPDGGHIQGGCSIVLLRLSG